MPFLGRQLLLDQITGWRRGRTGRPLLLVTGSGGSGKTRCPGGGPAVIPIFSPLSRETSTASRARGHAVVTIVAYRSAMPPSRGRDR